MPETTRLHRPGENLGSVNVELAAGDPREIKEAAGAIMIQVDQYSEDTLRFIYR